MGKTRLSLELARQYQTAILSADSRQCYREMTIGTAKPAPEDLRTVRHYFINSHSVKDKVNAGVFEREGLHDLKQIFSTNKVAVICGGTGLYIKALLDGIDRMPDIPEEIQSLVRQLYEEEGLPGLQQRLQEKDPAFYRQAEHQNPHRLMRALEVYEATGTSILSFQKNKRSERPFRTLHIGLELPKERLRENIIFRTKAMLQAGLVSEVKNLYGLRTLKALQTVGYQEIFRYLDGEYTLAVAEEQIALHTRQYAKRQMTWFRKFGGLQWFPADKTEAVLSYINEEINNFA